MGPFVTKILNYCKMTNWQISDCKVSMEVSWQNASIYHLEFSKTAYLVAKNVTKKTFEIFFSSLHASLKLLYSLCFLTYMKMVNSTWFYGPGTTTFAHKVFISTTFVTQSFDLKMTYFCHWQSQSLKVYFWILLLRRGPKVSRMAWRALGAPRAPKPSTGARRRGAGRSKLLEYNSIFWGIANKMLQNINISNESSHQYCPLNLLLLLQGNNTYGALFPIIMRPVW